MKSEPDVYPWEQLVEDKRTHWDGVRNYQARNMMRDDMKIGDLVFFYHSNFKPPHIAGVARICKEGYPDFTAQDSGSKYFDEKATPENPRWMMVDIEPISALENTVSLQEMRDNPALEGMKLLMSWIPAAFAVLSALLILFYPLSSERNSQIGDELELRRKSRVNN